MKFQLISPSRSLELEHNLRCARLNYSVDYYVKLSLLSSFILSLFISLLFIDLFLPVFLLSICFFYFTFMRLPHFLADGMALKIEADLPIQLRAISTELSIGLPFESALNSAVKYGDSTKYIFHYILEGINSGLPPEQIFNTARKLSSSRMMDKAISHLQFIYTHGYSNSGLNKLVDEISAEHKSRMKEYASRSSMLGIILIALSSVVPALMTTYILVGSSFMDISLTPSNILFIYTIILPLCILLLLFVMRFLSPSFNSRGSSLFSSSEITRFGFFLNDLKIKINPYNFLKYSLFFSLLLSIIVFYYTYSPFSIIFFMLPLVFYGIFLYLEDSRTSQIESYMPDALFYASSLHSFGLEKVVKELAFSNYGLLSSEFLKTYNQVKAGFSIKISLISLVERNNSLIIERGISLLIKIHDLGSSLENALRSTAEDIYDMFILMRERSSILSMMKYNLFVSALIVPAIFGAVISIVSSLDLTYISFLLGEKSVDLYPTILFSINIYLVEFSFLSSLFLADFSGSWKRFVIYLIFILPLTFILFFGVQTLI
jgi:hypothetical protein